MLRTSHFKFVQVAMVAFLALPPCIARGQVSRAVTDPTNLAVIKAENEGRLADAEKLLTSAIHDTEQRDPSSPVLALYLRRLASLYQRKEKLSDALALMNRALEIDEKAFGPAKAEVAADLCNLAALSKVRGNKGEQEKFLKQALDILRQDPKPEAHSTLSVLNNVSAFYISEQRWTEAEVLLKEGMEFCESLSKREQPSCDMFRVPLENVYRSQGRTAEGEQLRFEAIESAKTPAGRRSEGPSGLIRQAQQYVEEGKFSQAEEAYNQAIAWTEKERGPDDISELPFELFALASFLQRQGRKLEAEKLYTRYVELQLKAYSWKPAGSGVMSRSPLNIEPLLSLYRSEGRFSDMESILAHALELEEEYLGPRHDILANLLLTLADVYQEQEKFSDALPLYERAVDIQQTNFGPDNPQLVGTLRRYSVILHRLNEDARAAEVDSRIDAIQKKQPARAQPN